MDDKIISFGLRANKSTLITPVDCLKAVLASISKGGDNESCNKAIVILLDDKPDTFSYVGHVAGMHRDGAVLWLEYMKAEIIADMS